MVGSRAACRQVWCWSSSWEPTSWSTHTRREGREDRESTVNVKRLGTSKRAPNDTPPLARLSFLILPTPFHKLGVKNFNIWVHEGHSLENQHSCKWGKHPRQSRDLCEWSDQLYLLLFAVIGKHSFSIRTQEQAKTYSSIGLFPVAIVRKKTHTKCQGAFLTEAPSLCQHLPVLGITHAQQSPYHWAIALALVWVFKSSNHP